MLSLYILTSIDQAASQQELFLCSILTYRYASVMRKLIAFIIYFGLNVLVINYMCHLL